MYLITETKSGETHISDTIVEVALHKNGSYIRANEKKGYPAQGFCGLVPVTIQEPVYPMNEDGMPNYEAEPIGVEDKQVLQNIVFHYAGTPAMKGDEADATFVDTQAVPQIMELEGDLAEAYQLLYGE